MKTHSFSQANFLSQTHKQLLLKEIQQIRLPVIKIVIGTIHTYLSQHTGDTLLLAY